MAGKDVGEDVEERLRQLFLERRGQVDRESPHYFVLGESAWFWGFAALPKHWRKFPREHERRRSTRSPAIMDARLAGARDAVPVLPVW